MITQFKFLSLPLLGSHSLSCSLAPTTTPATPDLNKQDNLYLPDLWLWACPQRAYKRTKTSSLGARERPVDGRPG